MRDYSFLLVVFCWAGLGACARAADLAMPPAIKNPFRIGVPPSLIGFDSAGNIYLSGSTPDSLAAVAGATIVGRGAGSDVFVIKISPELQVQYIVEIGGSATALGIGASPVGMVVDPAGNVYVAGNTVSSDFPTTPGAFESSPSSGGGFLVKLDPSGKLIFSTYFDQTGTTVMGLAVDGNGNAYLAGNTTRPAFPTTKGAYLESGGISSASFVQIGFVSAIDSSGSTLRFSTFLGAAQGVIEDGISAIALDANGVVHICGGRGPGDFPTTHGAPFSVAAGNNYDGFLTRLNPSLSTLLYSTVLPFWGTSLEASPTGDSYLLAPDRVAEVGQNGMIAYNQPNPGLSGPNNLVLLDHGAVLIAGPVDRPSYPTVNTLQPCEPNLTQNAPTPSTPPGTQRMAATMFNADGNMTFSTLLGGIGQYGFAAVGHDLTGNLYLSGWTYGDGT